VFLINALTNAIVGSKKSKEKTIFVTSKRKNHTFLIDVMNSFDGVLNINPETGSPETSKKEGDHGLGFLNIRRVTEKYFGTAKLTKENDRVRLSAMMII
jgi:sensor histidine kinase YesM